MTLSRQATQPRNRITKQTTQQPHTACSSQTDQLIQLLDQKIKEVKNKKPAKGKFRTKEEETNIIIDLLKLYEKRSSLLLQSAEFNLLDGLRNTTQREVACSKDGMSPNSYEVEQFRVSKSVVDSRNKCLQRIRYALIKARNKRLGICEDCGDYIEFRHMREYPWTKFCLLCRQDYEARKRLRK